MRRYQQCHHRKGIGFAPQGEETKIIDLGYLATPLDMDRSSLPNTLSSQLSNINIDSGELRRAEEIISQVGMRIWKEETLLNFSTDIEKQDLSEIADIIATELRLNRQQSVQIEAEVEKMRFARSTGSRITEFSFNMGHCKSIFGFLYAEKKRNGKISLAVAFHKCRFSVNDSDGLDWIEAENIISIMEAMRGNGYRIDRQVLGRLLLALGDQDCRSGSLSESEIKQVMNTFMKHRAIQSLTRRIY